MYSLFFFYVVVVVTVPTELYTHFMYMNLKPQSNIFHFIYYAYVFDIRNPCNLLTIDWKYCENKRNILKNSVKKKTNAFVLTVSLSKEY